MQLSLLSYSEPFIPNGGSFKSRGQAAYIGHNHVIRKVFILHKG